MGERRFGRADFGLHAAGGVDDDADAHRSIGVGLHAENLSELTVFGDAYVAGTQIWHPTASAVSRGHGNFRCVAVLLRSGGRERPLNRHLEIVRLSELSWHDRTYRRHS